MDLNYSSSLSYLPPVKQVDGDIQYVSFKSQSGLGASYGPSDSIAVKLSSSSQFLIPQRSYCKFTIIPTAATTLSPYGGTSVFSSIQDNISGLALPIARNWHIQNSIKNSVTTNERKAIIGKYERWTGTNTGVSTTALTPIDIVCPMLSSIDFSEGNAIPLALLNGGMTQYYNLNASGAVVLTGSYTVTNFEIVACLLTPVQSYLDLASQKLAGGSFMTLPIQLFKSYTDALSQGSTSQTVQVNCGYLGSINSIVLSQRKSQTVAIFNGASKITSFNVDLDGRKYPLNKDIVGEGESFYMTLSSMNTELSSLSLPDPTQQFQYLSLKSNDTVSGVSSNNGQINLNLQLTANDAPFLETIVTYDAQIIISQNAVLLKIDV